MQSADMPLQLASGTDVVPGFNSFRAGTSWGSAAQAAGHTSFGVLVYQKTSRDTKLTSIRVGATCL